MEEAELHGAGQLPGIEESLRAARFANGFGGSVVTFLSGMVFVSSFVGMTLEHGGLAVGRPDSRWPWVLFASPTLVGGMGMLWSWSRMRRGRPADTEHLYSAARVGLGSFVLAIGAPLFIGLLRALSALGGGLQPGEARLGGLFWIAAFISAPLSVGLLANFYLLRAARNALATERDTPHSPRAADPLDLAGPKPSLPPQS